MAHWYHWVLLVIICLFMASCMSEQDITSLNNEIDKYKNLKEEVSQLIKDAKDGTITIPEMTALIEAKKFEMENSLEVIKDIQSRGVSWWEIMFISVLGAAGIRGVPSKGPIRGLINMFLARKPEENVT